jgi:hypothetical protein
MLVSYLHSHLPYHNTDAYLLGYRLIKRQEDSDSSRTTSRFTTVVYLSIVLLRMMSYLTQSLTNTDEAPQEDAAHTSHDASQESNAIPYPKKLPVGAGCLIPCENRCAICREPWIDPCASTGGYIFCYSCLVDYTQRYNRCPVSGSYCSSSDIIRVFLKD